jgi:hypothetical protein
VTYFYIVWARDPITGLENTSSEKTFTTSGAVVGNYPTPKPLVYLAKPVQAAPSPGQIIIDPQHGTEVYGFPFGPRVRYGSKQVVTRNKIYGVLDGTSGNRALFDAKSKVILNPNVTTYGGLTLSNTDDTKAYAYSNPNIIRYLNITPTGIVLDHSVPVPGVTRMILGGNQGSQDNADTFLALQCEFTNGSYGYILWGIESEQIEGQVVVASSGIWDGDGKTFDSCGIAQSGDWLLGGFAGNGTGVTQGQWRWPTGSFSNTNREQLTTQNRHWDAGLLEDGVTDVLFINSQNSTGTSNGGYSGIFRFDNGLWTPMVASWPNGSATCRNYLRPGWGYLSSFSDMDTNPTFPGYSTVIAVEFANPPVTGGDVEVYGNIHGPYSTTYEDQPNACPTPDGTEVYVNSTWDGAPRRVLAMGEDVLV